MAGCGSRVMLAMALAALAGGTLAEDRSIARARTDYMLHCSGCHGMDGLGKPEKGIPRFTDQVGHFLRLPEGRAFVMQVPGLLGVRLPDERAAAVTNWMIREFAGPSLPADFVPYSAAEARRHRESRPADIIGRRDEIYRTLLQQGLVIQ
jgi:hypothetical protein